MPPRKTQSTGATPGKKATAAKGGNPEPERFAAGTGPLTDEMVTSFEDTAVRAQAIRAQKLDAQGAPVGQPQHLGDATATLSFQPDDSGIELPGLAPGPAPGAALSFSTDDPAAVGRVRELMRIPIPTAVVAQWFPSYFRPPGADQPWNNCKVFLTPQGLYVYRAAPTEPETFTTGATPAWYSTVDFSKTAQPVTGYAAMNAGIPVQTAAGRVNVQPYAGCGCGHRKLKNWTPSWARNRISWADAVALADPTAGR